LVDILSIGQTGLTAAKKSLETTGHNISNVNTKGYSRQRVEQSTNIPITQQGLVQGSGVKVDGVYRMHDTHIQKRLQRSQSNESFSGKKFDELSQIENVFNELDRDGLNNILNTFYNSFRELSNQPDNETVRSIVRDKASLAVKDFKRIRSSLDQLARGIDTKLSDEVSDINKLTKDISVLNKKITQVEVIGDETGDLRDQRDLKVLELSKSFRVHTYNDNKGNFNVSAVGLGTLVSGGSHQELATRSTSIEDSSNSMDGSVEVYLKERPNSKITNKFKDGKLSAFIKVRNENIMELQSNIDEIAYEFANTVNAIHKRGYVNRPIETNERGLASESDTQGAVTGIDFFKVGNSARGMANNLELSDAVQNDLSNIVTALSPNSPGDNRVSLAISKLQHEKFMDGGKSTIEEHFLKTVGHVGTEAGKAKLDSQQDEAIRTQIETLRERTSGVSLDEEAANMVRFQHAYNASAKVMQAANEMFDTVLSIKR
jgi:flagellar hook-associated protein 1 FlgK